MTEKVELTLSQCQVSKLDKGGVGGGGWGGGLWRKKNGQSRESL